MAAKKKAATETDGQGATTGARPGAIPPLEGVDDRALKEVAAALRKVTLDKLYKAGNALLKVSPKSVAVAWHLAKHRAVPLFTLTGHLTQSFRLPPVSADEILDLLPRLRTELPPEMGRLPVLGDTWRHDEDDLLVAAYVLDEARVRARAAELPTPLALPFVAARFGKPIGADEGRAILGLLGEAIGERASFLQLPWATDRQGHGWWPANIDDAAAYYALLGRTFGDTAELDRGVVRGVRKATFRVSAEPYLGATSVATAKTLQTLWPQVPENHIATLTDRLLTRGEAPAFFLAAADAARARVKEGTDDGPTRYAPDAEHAFAAADFYLALAALASGVDRLPPATDARWTLAGVGETDPQRNRLLRRAFARLPRDRALAIAEHFLVDNNSYFQRVMVILAAHFDGGLYERVLARAAASGSASFLLGLPGAAALSPLAAAYDRAEGPLQGQLHQALWEALAETHRAGEEAPAEHDRFVDFFHLGRQALTENQLLGLGVGEDLRGRDALRALPEGRREAALRRAIAPDQLRPSKPWVWAYTVASDDFLRVALEVVLTSTRTWSPGFDHLVVQGITSARPRVLPMLAAIFPRVADDAKVRAALQQALTGSELAALGMG